MEDQRTEQQQEVAEIDRIAARLNGTAEKAQAESRPTGTAAETTSGGEPENQRNKAGKTPTTPRARQPRAHPAGKKPLAARAARRKEEQTKPEPVYVSVMDFRADGPTGGLMLPVTWRGHVVRRRPPPPPKMVPKPI